jgi:hypothetical protein
MKILLLFSLLALPTVAQTDTTKPYEKSIYWTENCPECSFIVRNGNNFRTLKIDGLNVTVIGFIEGDKVLRLYLSIENATGKRIEFTPSTIYASVFNSGDPKSAQWLNRLGAEDVAKLLPGKSKWKDFQDRARANSSQQTGTITTDTGRTATITATDPAARAIAEDQITDRNTRAEAKERQLSTEILRANSVLNGETVRGFVFFERKKGSVVNYHIIIDRKLFGLSYTN